MKRIQGKLAVLLVALLLMPAQIFAAENPTTSEIAPDATEKKVTEEAIPEETSQEYKLRLEEKYLISIQDPDELFSKEGGYELLQRFDEALENMGVDFVKEVIGNYRDRGATVTYKLEYVKPADSYSYTGLFTMKRRQTTISLRTNMGEGNLELSNCVTAHEFGHLIHFDLIACLNKSELNKQWEKLNNGLTYQNMMNTGYDGNGDFVTAYGRTAYYEDFGVIFENTAGCNHNRTYLLNKLEEYGKDCAIAKKMQFMDKLLSENYENWRGLEEYGFIFAPVADETEKETINTELQTKDYEVKQDIYY